MTGFEPATTRPPDAYSNRAELHPAHLRLQRYNKFVNKQLWESYILHIWIKKIHKKCTRTFEYRTIRLSRNLLWTRFCLLLYSTAVINLYCSLLFSSSLSIRSFHNWKEPKGSGTRKVQSDSSLLRSCKQHPSVKEPLPLEPFCWFLGDADLPQLVTRLQRAPN